jgi:hypothetical protein
VDRRKTPGADFLLVNMDRLLHAELWLPDRFAGIEGSRSFRWRSDWHCWHVNPPGLVHDSACLF